MTGTVHGAYKQLGGAVAAGQLVITVNTEGQVVRDPVGNVVFQGPQAVKLNKDGLVTLTLPASDDSTLEPSGFTYAIVEQLSHVARASYRIVEFQVTNGGTIELADLAATDEAALDPSYGANLNAVLAELDGRLSADEITASFEAATEAATAAGEVIDAGVAARLADPTSDTYAAGLDLVGLGTAAAVTACGCRVYRTTTLAVPNATETVISFNAEDYDTNGFHEGVTHPTRVTIPVGRGGVYSMAGSTEWQSGGTAAGTRGIAIRKNGTSYCAQGPTITNPITGEMRQQVVAPGVHLAAGDYVELTLYQNAGSSQTVVPYVANSSALGPYAFEVVQVGKS